MTQQSTLRLTEHRTPQAFRTPQVPPIQRRAFMAHIAAVQMARIAQTPQTASCTRTMEQRGFLPGSLYKEHDESFDLFRN